MQVTKLERLVSQARQHVPYYKKTLACEYKSGSVYEVLSCFPILTKDAIRLNSENLVSRDLDPSSMWFGQTGGSTGAPLKVAKTLNSRSLSAAALLRGFTWAGLQPGDISASLKAHGQISTLGSIRARLRGEQVFTSALSTRHLREVVIPALIRRRPTYVTGYPTSLLALAEQLDDGELHVPIIMTTGEMLYPEQRKHLERVLRGRVFDYNGSNEVEGIGFECDHGSRHVTDEQVIVEVVDDNGVQIWNQTGRILVTDLRNDGMPFIRYELGDLGMLSQGKCSCGRELRILGSLEGRTQDAIVSRSGVSLSGVMFAGRFRDLRLIRAYQAVQTGIDAMDLRYVPVMGGADAEVREMVTWIESRLGRGFSVTPVRVDDIPLTRAGKSRLVMGIGKDRA